VSIENLPTVGSGLKFCIRQLVLISPLRDHGGGKRRLFTWWKVMNSHNLPAVPKMARMVKPSSEEVARAFRKIAKDLGCDESEQRFRDVLFTLGTQKIGDAPKPAAQRTSSTKRSSGYGSGGYSGTAPNRKATGRGLPAGHLRPCDRG
jgi:hypothetical protein